MTPLDTLLARYPELASQLQSLQILLARGPYPQVLAIGDYNTGKSSLLNALMAQERFAVADRRETRQLQSALAHGVAWLDTPGLHADPSGQDDTLSLQAIDHADHLLLLHALSNGELAPDLLQLAQGRDATLVLTRIDECEPAQQQEILAKISQQWQGPLFLCSSQYWQTGLRLAQPELQELSGIPALRQQLLSAAANWLTCRQQALDRERFAVNRKLRGWAALRKIHLEEQETAAMQANLDLLRRLDSLRTQLVN